MYSLHNRITNKAMPYLISSKQWNLCIGPVVPEVPGCYPLQSQTTDKFGLLEARVTSCSRRATFWPVPLAFTTGFYYSHQAGMVGTKTVKMTSPQYPQCSLLQQFGYYISIYLSIYLYIYNAPAHAMLHGMALHTHGIYSISSGQTNKL